MLNIELQNRSSTQLTLEELEYTLSHITNQTELTNETLEIAAGSTKSWIGLMHSAPNSSKQFPFIVIKPFLRYRNSSGQIQRTTLAQHIYSHPPANIETTLASTPADGFHPFSAP